MTGDRAPGAGDGQVTGSRRVHRSAPSAPAQTIVLAEFSRLACEVYKGLRDGTVDPEVTFDLACHLIEWAPYSEPAQRLAEQSMAGDDPGRLADLARQVLDSLGFEPDFEAEPRLLGQAEQALEAVRSDLRADGLDGPDRLVVADGGYPRYLWADFRGTFAHGSGVTPADARDPVRALVAVAADMQDAVMHAMTAVWPVCPAHGLGGHARELERQAVWWCNGGPGGHVIATIGQWPGDQPAHHR
ncbi:MAG: hypothetical protein ACHP9Z_29380 [Streptosporangiales bacterium]